MGYLVAGLTDRYAIHLVGPGLRVTRIEHTVKPVPVRAEEKAEPEARITWGMGQRDPAWRWRGAAMPDTKPPYRALTLEVTAASGCGYHAWRQKRNPRSLHLYPECRRSGGWNPMCSKSSIRMAATWARYQCREGRGLR